MIKNKNKKAMEMEMLAWWIIGLVVLVIVILAIVVFKDKGISAIEYLKSLFKFR